MLVFVAGCAVAAPETADHPDILPHGGSQDLAGDLGGVGDAGDLGGADLAGDLATVDQAGIDLAGVDQAGVDMNMAVDMNHMGDMAHSGSPDLAPSCTPGASCTVAGNVGACAAGKIVCTSGAPVCVGSVTTQSCYSGPAGTAGKGICKAGTQSCVGSLGTCTGQVLPTTENCFNSTDDDCNGTVNNTCPSAVTTGAQTNGPEHGGTSDGEAGSSICPAGSVVTGFTLADDEQPYLGGVQVDCAPISLVTNDATSSYSIGFGTTTLAADGWYGGESTGTTDYRCGASQAGVAADTYASNSKQDVDGTFLYCGTAALTLGAGNKLSAVWTAVSTSSSDGFTYNHGDAAGYDACGAGQVLVGFNIQAGAWVYGLQAVCAQLAFTYTP